MFKVILQKFDGKFFGNDFFVFVKKIGGRSRPGIVDNFKVPGLVNFLKAVTIIYPLHLEQNINIF